MICDYCEREYDPISTRWLCPHCHQKTNCCDGAPLPDEHNGEPATTPKRYGINAPPTATKTKGTTMSRSFHSGPRVGMGVFVVRRGRFLMGKRLGSHGADTWSIPGGHQEFGESFEQTSRREVAEETGLLLTDVNLAGVTNDYHEGWGTHHVTLWMVGSCYQGESVVLEPDKFVDHGWYDFESLPDPLFFPWQQLMDAGFYPRLQLAIRATAQQGDDDGR